MAPYDREEDLKSEALREKKSAEERQHREEERQKQLKRERLTRQIAEEEQKLRELTRRISETGREVERTKRVSGEFDAMHRAGIRRGALRGVLGRGAKTAEIERLEREDERLERRERELATELSIVKRKREEGGRRRKELTLKGVHETGREAREAQRKLDVSKREAAELTLRLNDLRRQLQGLH